MLNRFDCALKKSVETVGCYAWDMYASDQLLPLCTRDFVAHFKNNISAYLVDPECR